MNKNHVADLMPDRPIGSVYEVALLYSLCSEYENQSDFEDTHADDDLNISANTLQYLTPNDVESEEETKVIFAKVDLTQDEPRLDSEPVEVERYDESLKFKIGYISNPKKSGAAIDYSLTNHLGSSGTDVETISHDSWGNRFLRGRFEKWGNKEESEELKEEDWDYNIIESLQTLADDKEEMNRLENSLLSKYPEDKEIEGFVTVKFKVDDEGYKYPSYFEEINKVGMNIVNNKLRKGRNTNSGSFGEGLGMISEEKGIVVGASDGTFASYSKQQRDAFPDLNVDRSWEQRPLSEPIAKAISGFNSVEDHFGFTVGGLYMVHLPYPIDKISVDVFEDFYNNVYKQLKNHSESHNYINNISNILNNNYKKEKNEPLQELEEKSTIGDNSNKNSLSSDTASSKYRLYSMMAEKEQHSVYNIFFEELNTNIDTLFDISNSYKSIVDSIHKKGYFEPLFCNFEDSDYNLMNIHRTDSNIIPQLLYGSFLSKTSYIDIDEKYSNNINGTNSDSRIQFSERLLRGDSLNIDKILRYFVNKTEREYRDGIETDDGFPDLWPVVQSMQLHALSDLLVTESINNYKFKDMDVLSTTQNKNKYDSRNERLEDFLKNHNALSNETACAVFLTGGLIGYVNTYQDYEGISKGLVSKYPIKSANRRSIQDIMASALNKLGEYEDAEGYSMATHYTSRLPSVMLSTDPSNWDITNSELQWFYSLGIAYGKNDYNNRIDSEKTDEEDKNSN